MKNIGIYIFLIGIGVFIAFGLIELGLRVGLIPNIYAKRLVREGETVSPKMRLVILGDSFIAKGEELSEILASRLKPEGVEILNLALRGMGPYDYRDQIATYGLSFRPDMVLLSYYVGNDLTDVQYEQEEETTLVGKLKDGIKSFAGKSYTYLVLKEKLSYLWAKHYLNRHAVNFGIDPTVSRLIKTGEMNPWFVKLSIVRPNYLLDNVLMETDGNMKAWEQVKDVLTQIHDLCRGVDAELRVVIFPRGIQLNRKHFDFFKKMGFNLDEGILHSQKPQRLLLQFCEENGIRCLNLLPYFKERKSEDFYLIYDDHLNRKGNEIVAELISGFILNET